MLFNTIDFVIFFIILLTAVSILRTRKYQHLLLLIGSYFFFYYSSNYLFFLLILSTLLDYFVGHEIWKAKNITKRKIQNGWIWPILSILKRNTGLST